MIKKINISILLISLLMLSCQSDEFIYDNNQGFDNNTWTYSDAKNFDIEIKDSMTPVKLFINLRNTIDYPYSNIYMFLHSHYPDGYEDIDTLEFFLADPHGNWLGDHSGTIIENRALISKGVFQTAGTYSFKLEQAMRNDSLPELLDVGMRVELLTEF